jgi:hypothetical protein
MTGHLSLRCRAQPTATKTARGASPAQVNTDGHCAGRRCRTTVAISHSSLAGRNVQTAGTKALSFSPTSGIHSAWLSQ